MLTAIELCFFFFLEDVVILYLGRDRGLEDLYWVQFSGSVSVADSVSVSVSVSVSDSVSVSVHVAVSVTDTVPAPVSVSSVA